MGKKLDALFGRSFKASKLKALLNLAISRIAVFKNQRQARSKQALSDVLQLLQQPHHQRALLRVEHVMKEQDMIDLFDKVEGYCNLLIERLHLIEQERECPEELKEATAGIIYAASRCGEFPELQEIRAVLTSRYGKHFTASAVELRNNCGVHPQMVQKLSTRMPSLERRMKTLKEIASRNSIVLQLEDASSEEQLKDKRQNQLESKTREEQNLHILTEGGRYGELSDSFKSTQKYKDVADAAQAAFESAAYAAAAAKAAVELYRSESRDPDDQNDTPSPQSRKMSNGHHDCIEVASQPEGKEILSDTNSSQEILKDISASVDVEAKVEDNENDNMLRNPHSSKPIHRDTMLDAAISGSKMQSISHLGSEKRPFSVRTKHVRGY